MQTFLVYETEIEARRDERIIFRRGAQIAVNSGYEVDENGIASKNAEGETTDSLTVRWDRPRKRMDGKWVIRHPIMHDDARNEAWLTFVMAGIAAPAEVEDVSWWPVVPAEPVSDLWIPEKIDPSSRS